MAKLTANSGDPNPMPYSVASDLCLHCLPFILFRLYRFKWVIVIYGKNFTRLQ